jgi:steroid delta-isomerase-like uncharacterized protein
MSDTRAAIDLVRAYYDAFNARDVDRFLALLHDEVAHDISQGGRETGREAFRRFLDHMNDCYAERVEDLVIMTSPDGQRAAAEFTIDGRYLKTDGGLPAAKGQAYRLPVGAFFELRDGKIARISNHYNVKDWLAQVTGSRPS